MKVMIVVTHLLGTGHLTRALTLAQAFDAAGHSVTLVSGGVKPAGSRLPDFAFRQLEALKSDGINFSRLLTQTGAVATDADFALRERQMLAALAQTAPDVLITELFPFGRRILKAEFLTLLQAAKDSVHPPRIFASIRDILAPPSKQKKADFAAQTIAAFYNGVLVHADRDVTPLSLSWPVTPALEATLHYTGFVAKTPAPIHPDALGAGEVIVSAGGGSVGDPLFACAAQAARRDPDRTWRLLLGGENAQMRSLALMHDGPANLIAEPARPEFRQMLHHAAASVSLCGYNTALDLLQTPCPGVFVPFDEGSEVEQTIRARALAKQPGFAMIAAAQLTPEAMLSAIQQARQHPRTPAPMAQMNGAKETVRIVTKSAALPTTQGASSPDAD